jgi:hypothetical protein
MEGKTFFVHLVIIHVKSWKTKRLKSHHSKSKNSHLQISSMKHFNYLNQGIHVNNLKMKNRLDHQSTIRSITLLPMKIVQSYIWTMIYEWKCKCKCFHLIFNKRCWPLSLVARTIECFTMKTTIILCHRNYVTHFQITPIMIHLNHSLWNILLKEIIMSPKKKEFSKKILNESWKNMF